MEFKWGISSVGRAIGSQSIGQGFNSPILHFFFKSRLEEGYMSKTIIIKFLVILLCFTAIGHVFAQGETTAGSETAGTGEKPQAGKIDPVFPEENKNIIFVEGERAVATNFFKEPIKNFGCSGKRSLQLNRSTGLQGGAAFYADYLFYVEEPGTFELWYGGTPPGPQEEDMES